MMFVVLSALASALFGSGYKLATMLNVSRPAVNVCMLLTGTLLTGTLTLSYEGLAFPRPAVIIGMLAGVALFLTTTAFFQVMRYGRLAIQWTVLNMSVAIPTGVSIVVWDERPTLLLALGMVLTVIALILMGIDRGKNVHTDPAASRFDPAQGWGPRLRWLGLVAFAFATTGLVQVCNKALIQAGAGDYKFTYTFLCYATAGLLAVGYLLAYRGQPRAVEWRLGAAMALGITLATILLLFALETLPGIVVFPARIVFVIVFTAGLSVLLWKESLQAPGVLGLITAAAAISCFGLG